MLSVTDPRVILLSEMRATAWPRIHWIARLVTDDFARVSKR